MRTPVLLDSIKAVVVLLAALTLFTPPPAGALWSSDPAVNLAVADGPGEQAVPKIAGQPDGSCYVGWFDNASGNYDVRLQRLDPSGNEMWPHNGILVSGHPQDSWITDWDMICDSQGNCVLTFTDIRSGNWDAQAYKITPEGDFAWGPDGITLSHDPEPDMMSAVCEATDGDFVFAWGVWPDAASGWMMMQRLAPDGTLRLADGGVCVIREVNETPSFADLEPSSDGDALLMWVRDVRTTGSPRHIRLQRFAPDATPVWPSFVAIYDAGAVPMGYAPRILSDAAGGAVCGWHRSLGTMITCLAQHVTADGVELFAHNGVLVSTNSTRHHIDPATAYHPDSGEIFVFWNERNSSQGQRGIYGQRLSAAGARLWGSEGLVLRPVDLELESYPRTVPLEDGAVCFYTDTPAGFTGDRLVAQRLDAAGTNLWLPVPLHVSTARSTKADLPLFIDHAGMTRIAWEDSRNGTPDVYAQNVSADGILGADPAGIGEPRPVARGAASAPNPFRGSTTIRLARGAGSSGDLVIAGPDGRIVRRVALETSAADTWQWDGRDDAGREVPAGVYTYRWMLGSEAGTSGKAVVVR